MKIPASLDLVKIRLEEIATYGILGSTDEECYDFLTQMAAEICHTEFAFISIVLEDSVWFKSNYGVEIKELKTDDFYCFRAIEATNDIYIETPDASVNKKKNPKWHNYFPEVKFYAGVPLRSSNGIGIGTLCVMDSHIQHLS